MTDNSNKTYQPTWDSLNTYGVPDWFSDAKFGLYAHWGLYSVPGFGNEWYGKWMYDPEHAIHKQHIKKFGSLSTFGYKEFGMVQNPRKLE
jgi:alpha-L-fucosidase